jgi:quercetin dioxygenase-like cupin family protein
MLSLASRWRWLGLPAVATPQTPSSAVMRRCCVRRSSAWSLGLGSEHNNPGEATVLVLNGHVRLAAADVSWEGHRGDLLIVPDSRHSLEAVEDSAVLLTVAKTRR